MRERQRVDRELFAERSPKAPARGCQHAMRTNTQNFNFRISFEQQECTEQLLADRERIGTHECQTRVKGPSKCSKVANGDTMLIS